MNEILDLVLIKEVVYPIVIIFSGILVYAILSNSIKKVFKAKISKIDVRRSKTLCSVINNILKYLIFIICLIAILEVYGISTKGFLASLGVVGVVAGLAFQDTLKDLLSGFSIIFENEYAVGDVITVKDFKGKVISLGLKTTKIQSITGEIKIISNSNITEVINHSLDDSYEFIDIPISYDEKIEKVEKVLSELCDKILKEQSDLLDVTLLGVNELSNSSIIYRVMIKTKTMKQYEIKRIMLKNIKNEFDKNKITIPYSQVVVHNARV